MKKNSMFDATLTVNKSADTALFTTLISSSHNTHSTFYSKYLT